MAFPDSASHRCKKRAETPVTVGEWVLDRHLVRCTFGSMPTAFVIDLGRRHMAVSEQFLNLDEFHLCIKQERRRCRTQRMRGINADPRFRAIGTEHFAGGIRQCEKVPQKESVHRKRLQTTFAEGFASRVLLRPEKRARGEFGLCYVFLYRLAGSVMEADGAATISFLAKPNSCTRFVGCEIRN